MNTNWPVGETWRASFFLGALMLAGGVAAADARDLVTAARAQDPAATARFANVLSTENSSERAAAAFALGQLGVAWEPIADADRARAESLLLAALAREHEANVRDRMIEALGKVGAQPALTALDALVDGEAAARAAIAIATLAKKGLHPAAATRGKLERIVRAAPDSATREGAALALLRINDAASREAMRAALRDSSWRVRAIAAQTLGELGVDGDAPLMQPLRDDNDVRVAAEAARALTKLAMRCKAESCAPLEALAKSRGPWRAPVMAAVAFEHWRDARAVPMLRARFDEYKTAALDTRTRALLACKAALAHDRARGQLELLKTCGSGIVDDAHRGVMMAQALAAVGGAELAALARSKFPAVRAAAAEGADAATVRALLADGDALVIEAAADRAAELELKDAGPLLIAAMARLHGADSLEAQQSLLGAGAKLHVGAMARFARSLLDAQPYALRQAAAHALTILDGKAVIARPPAPPADAPPRLPPVIARLSTTRGIIRVRLFVDDAPRTVANFVSLTRKRFYDGLAFHRVVPDFVSQGGDPRGDGSGGPGYMIPCEINMHRYGEGVMGMALAGRDTGGSQFFFTQAPEPHLDGRYTVLGEIIEGLDVAINLVEGDLIRDARIE